MTITAIQGDITKLEVDPTTRKGFAEAGAIVNAANKTLLGGGGVDGAIHRAAGPKLLLACTTLGGCKTGEAKITKGFKLPASHVIHTVGPVWKGGANNERALLANCYRSCMKLADAHHLTSIAFPCISTGIYDFPKEEAAAIATDTIAEVAATTSVEKVIFCCFSQNDLNLYQARLG